MANVAYPLGLQVFLTAGLDWSSAGVNIKAILVTSSYTYSSAHQFISDIPGGDIVVRSGNLASKSATAGVANAANITITAVSGPAANAFILAHDTGTDSTSPLLTYTDTGTNLPITPNGGDITIAWDTGANKIFRL